jgi:hypothetical protein
VGNAYFQRSFKRSKKHPIGDSMYSFIKLKSMKKLTLLSLLLLASLAGNAQEKLKNTLSTSIIRRESNSQSLYGNYQTKFLSGLEYTRSVGKWSFGIKGERGLTEFYDDCSTCYDHYYGTAYIKEHNLYLTTYYSFLHFFDSKLIFNGGMDLYYSKLHYYGDFDGGYTFVGNRADDKYKTVGLSPHLSISYFPIKRLFISINSNVRIGVGEMNGWYSDSQGFNEFVINALEWRVGVRF